MNDECFVKIYSNYTAIPARIYFSSLSFFNVSKVVKYIWKVLPPMRNFANISCKFSTRDKFNVANLLWRVSHCYQAVVQQWGWRKSLQTKHIVRSFVAGVAELQQNTSRKHRKREHKEFNVQSQ